MKLLARLTSFRDSSSLKYSFPTMSGTPGQLHLGFGLQTSIYIFVTLWSSILAELNIIVTNQCATLIVTSLRNSTKYDIINIVPKFQNGIFPWRSLSHVFYVIYNSRWTPVNSRWTPHILTIKTWSPLDLPGVHMEFGLEFITRTWTNLEENITEKLYTFFEY